MGLSFGGDLKRCIGFWYAGIYGCFEFYLALFLERGELLSADNMWRLVIKLTKDDDRTNDHIPEELWTKYDFLPPSLTSSFAEIYILLYKFFVL